VAAAPAGARQNLSRAALLRHLGISERLLRSWEKRGLAAPREQYGFAEIVALRTLDKLRRARVPTAKIVRALEALRAKLRGVRNPLTELRIYAEGRSIRVEVEGRAMDSFSGQLLLDFDSAELERLVAMPDRPTRAERHNQKMLAEHWFQRGLELEQAGAPVNEIIAAYEKAVELDPRSAGALVNLGTLFFNARLWREAEKYYVAAVEADGEYALAHFNLGNLRDEQGDRARALFHYQAALRIQPNYADAHYNVALLYQATGQALKAVQHWKAYLKLDPGSAWASIARRELKKLRADAIVAGSER
jgi:tetratricopeptide (TPR) repeat protein